MADATRVLNQVKALLNASVGRIDGSKDYDAVGSGDKARPIEEITETCLQAALEVATAVCETEGHAFRDAFVDDVTLTDKAQLPTHVGATSIPVITPFAGAGFTIDGTRRDYNQIDSWRRNLNDVYDDVAHDASDEDGNASLLAGAYDIVNNRIRFTGHSATMSLATFDRSDVWTKLDDKLEPAIVKVALGNSAKEGDSSDGLFASWSVRGENDMNRIRSGATVFEPVDIQVAARGKEL